MCSANVCAGVRCGSSGMSRLAVDKLVGSRYRLSTSVPNEESSADVSWSLFFLDVRASSR
jgi:hypothetical protein